MDSLENFKAEIQSFYHQHQHTYVPPYPQYRPLYQQTTFVRKHPEQLSRQTRRFLDRLSFPWNATPEDCRWYYNFYLLRAYYQLHGHSRVSAQDPVEPRLVSWVTRQQTLEEQLTPEQRDLLNSVDFTWRQSRLHRWNAMFEKLASFFQEHGHTMVPSTYADQRLATWVVRQRMYPERLDQPQYEQLRSLGFQFDMKRQKQLVWEYMFQQLLLYKRQHGHTNVPQGDANKRLANWVRRHRLAENTLNPDRLDKLRSIGFEFAAQKHSKRQTRWMQQYQAVSKHLKEYNRLPDDERLQQWYYRQFRRSPKTEQEEKLLKKIGINHT